MADDEPNLWSEDEIDPAAWDYVSDTTPGEAPAKQRASGKKHKSWWHDDRNRRDTARTKAKVIGFNYRDTFDDSDDYWYRRNSFQYSSAQDYSPSRQFRAFYTPTASYFATAASGELANKCLNALRALTRSANTIVDKTENANYLVQIKAGAESVQLNQPDSAEKKMLYVNSDALAAAKTTDDEDRVIDELTGFVLLRVQLTESNKPEVIDKINATGFHGLTGDIVNKMLSSPELADPKAIAETSVGRYLAGLISKSMLARLARKDVIKNWGGFGPYFARHAAKFASVGERLKTQTAENTETVVARIAYNLLNDETPLPLSDNAEDAKNIEGILAAHFETEVPPEDLLARSVEVVTKINEYFAAKAVPPKNMGETSAALEEAIEKLKKHLTAENERHEELAAEMSQVGEEFNKQFFDARTALEHQSVNNNGLEIDDAAMAEIVWRACDAAIKELEHAITPEMLAQPSYKFDANTKNTVRNIAKAVSPIPARESAEPEKIKRFSEKVEKLIAELKECRAKKFDEYKEKTKKAINTYKQNANQLNKALTQQLENLKNTLDMWRRQTTKIEKEITAPELSPLEKEALRVKAQVLAAARNIATRRRDILSSVRSGVTHDTTEVGTIANSIEKHTDANFGPVAAGGIAAQELSRTKGYIIRLEQLANTAATASNTGGGGQKIDSTMDAFNAEMQKIINSKNQAMSDKSIFQTAKNAIKATQSLKTMRAGEMHAFVSQMTGTDIIDSEATRNKEGAFACMNLTQNTIEKIAPYDDNKESAKIKEIVKAIKTATENSDKNSAVDNELFEPKELAALRRGAGGLDTDTAALVNKEANNAQEEEFVAFLRRRDAATARPRIDLVKPRPHEYEYGARIAQEILTRNKSAIQNIQNALMFQAGKRSVEEHGLISGDLDEGSLHKLGYDSEHVWSRKNMMRLPDVAVGLLIDQSGSMSGPKIAAAREMCIVMAAALQKIQGVQLYIYGHTANHRGEENVTLFEHYRPNTGNRLTNLGMIEAMSNNYDGYALKEAARLVSAAPTKRKYMFVIADGFPAGSGYGGDNARKHVASVVKFLRERWRIQTYAFGVGIDNEKDFCAQYGKERTVFVDNVRACQNKIVRFLKNALQKEKSLIGVSD